jgi:hypothetical protein
MTASVGDRFRSATGNTFRVVTLDFSLPLLQLGVVRENARGKVDEGHVYRWIPQAFASMEKLSD